MKPPKLWSRHNLPSELWPEILCLLPVKTLFRFRRVSKLWRTLIDDPDFALLHLQRFLKNHSQTHLIDLRGPVLQDNLKVRSIPSLKVTARLPFPHIVDFQDWEEYWSPLSSLDGLFMLIRYHPTSEANRWLLHPPLPELMLWNPATRRTLNLPPSPVISNDSERVSVVDLGLGFDPSIKQYKHVRLFAVLGRGIDSVAVYSLSTNSWKMIHCDDRKWRQFSLSENEDLAFCVRGFLFRLAKTKELGSFKLVTFNFKSETLASVKLPVENEVPLQYPSLTMADDGCSLAIVSCSYGSGSVWVLEGLADDDIKSWTWSKHHTFAPKIPHYEVHLSQSCFFYLIKNGELLLQWRTMMTSYNLQTHEEKIIMKKNLQTRAWPYKESLVMLN